VKSEHSQKEHDMSDTKQATEDLVIFEQLNLDYNNADQGSDAQRLTELLAEGFIAQTPGVTRNREEYLEYVAKPRPFKDLAPVESRIRILGDPALIHGGATHTMIANGMKQEVLHADVYQKRARTWVCVSACAIAPSF
jgi:hypothetical protein